MVGHRNAVLHAPVEESDDLEVEGGADPHSVGIDEFLDDPGAGGLATDDDLQGLTLQICNLTKFCDERVGLGIAEEESRLVPVLPAGRLMEVIQAEAPFGVLADGREVAGRGPGIPGGSWNIRSIAAGAGKLPGFRQFVQNSPKLGRLANCSNLHICRLKTNSRDSWI